MTNLYLIRHGKFEETDTNGFLGGALTAKGIEQAQMLVKRLQNSLEIQADALFSSTMLRAVQTAEILAPVWGLPVILEDDLQEWHNFDHATITGKEFISGLKETPYDQRAFYISGPDCESWAQFNFRVCTALNGIAQNFAGKNVVIVCHGGVIEASFLYCYGLSPLQPSPMMLNLNPRHTSITHWFRLGSTAFNLWWRLEKYNDYAHLSSAS